MHLVNIKSIDFASTRLKKAKQSLCKKRDKKGAKEMMAKVILFHQHYKICAFLSLLYHFIFKIAHISLTFKLSSFSSFFIRITFFQSNFICFFLLSLPLTFILVDQLCFWPFLSWWPFVPYFSLLSCSFNHHFLK